MLRLISTRGVGLIDADDAADFRRGVELPLALAALGSEMAHQVFVGIAENVIADGGLAFQRHHIPETRAWRNLDRGEWLTGVFVTDIFDEQHHQHIILVLAGIHAAAQFIAT